MKPIEDFLSLPLTVLFLKYATPQEKRKLENATAARDILAVIKVQRRVQKRVEMAKTK